jgi:hypothetical protein
MDFRGVPPHDRQTDAQPGSYAPWATANSRPGRATMRKRRARSRILKRMARPVASDFVEDAVIGLLQRIRPRAEAPAKMEVRASRSS